jgi:hypothetical protein
MRKYLPFVAILAVAASPVAAQGATTNTQAPTAEKPKTVTKIVCERVTVEEETGSRLGAAPKKCRKVEVPAKPEAAKSADSTTPNGQN